MVSMGVLRRRASLVRRMGSRVSSVIEEHDGDEERVREALQQTYGSWVIWLTLAMELLPILIELFKSLQDRSKWRRQSQSLVADLSMQAMHDGDSAANVLEDYELAGEHERALFLRRLFSVFDSETPEIAEP